MSWEDLAQVPKESHGQAPPTSEACRQVERGPDGSAEGAGDCALAGVTPGWPAFA